MHTSRTVLSPLCMDVIQGKSTSKQVKLIYLHSAWMSYRENPHQNKSNWSISTLHGCHTGKIHINTSQTDLSPLCMDVIQGKSTSKQVKLIYLHSAWMSYRENPHQNKSNWSISTLHGCLTGKLHINTSQTVLYPLFMDVSYRKNKLLSMMYLQNNIYNIS